MYNTYVYSSLLPNRCTLVGVIAYNGACTRAVHCCYGDQELWVTYDLYTASGLQKVYYNPTYHKTNIAQWVYSLFQLCLAYSMYIWFQNRLYFTPHGTTTLHNSSTLQENSTRSQRDFADMLTISAAACMLHVQGPWMSSSTEPAMENLHMT